MPAQTTILGQQPPTDREILVGNPTLEMPATGWAGLREVLWLPHPYWIKRGDLRDAPAPESGLFVVQDLRTLEWRAGCPLVEVYSLGIAQQDGKDYKIEATGSLSEDLSLASGVYVTPPTIWRYGYPRVTKLWVSLTTPSIYDHVGVPSAPPETFGLPTTTWAMAWVSETDWSAIGWVGESRSLQKLPGSNACLVTDTWLWDPGYPDRDGVAPGIIYT